MNTDAAYELVFGAGETQQALCEYGRFPESWLLDYYAALDFARASFDGESAWPKRLFQAFHYASTHLPLRYRVWTNLSRSSNAETERSIAEIQFETEEYLWSTLSGVACWNPNMDTTDEGALGKSDARLIELCFGDMSPVGEVDEYTSFRSWKELYEECLRNIELNWKSADCWPKWLCMAIHFSSFYIDLFQSQCIDIANAVIEVEDDTLRTRVDNVVRGLRNEIKNENVLQLIHLWLSSCSFKRDVSGLPEIGERRPRTGQFVSVRTMSEVFLLGDISVGAS